MTIPKNHLEARPHISVAQLRRDLTKIMKRVKAGETFIITYKKEAIARLEPIFLNSGSVD